MMLQRGVAGVLSTYVYAGYTTTKEPDFRDVSPDTRVSRANKPNPGEMRAGWHASCMAPLLPVGRLRTGLVFAVYSSQPQRGLSSGSLLGDLDHVIRKKPRSYHRL